MMEKLASALVDAISRLSLGQEFFSGKSSQRMARQFAAAGFSSADANAYLSGSLFLSLALSLFLFASLSLFIPLLDSSGWSLLASGAFFLALFLLPRTLAMRQEELVESELPFMLREFSVYLDIGMPFERALAKLSERDYALCPRLASAYAAIRAGSTVQSELSSISSGFSALSIKRSMMLLSAAYETGSSTESLRRMAEELSVSQLSKMRAQSSRFSLLAIVFIATSALIPSFFAVFAALSPLSLGTIIPEWQIWVAFLVFFPALNLASLGASFLLLPPAPKGFSSAHNLENEFLQKHGFPFGTRTFAALALAASLALCLLLFTLGQNYLALISLCIAPVAYSLVSYAAGREIEEAESRLPDALYSAASTHKLMSAEKMLIYLSRSGFGRLSEAFALALRRQKAGESFPRSMEAASRHCPSPLVARALSLLSVCYETGADMYFALRESAQDVVSFFALIRERSALLALQRYTVLASAAFLVPLIIGTVVFIAPSVSEASLNGTLQEAHLSSLPLACQIYLLLNSAISSVLLALSETRSSRAALYFAFSAPLSQLIFAAASGGALSLAPI